MLRILNCSATAILFGGMAGMVWRAVLSEMTVVGLGKILRRRMNEVTLSRKWETDELWALERRDSTKFSLVPQPGDFGGWMRGAFGVMDDDMKLSVSQGRRGMRLRDAVPFSQA